MLLTGTLVTPAPLLQNLFPCPSIYHFIHSGHGNVELILQELRSGGISFEPKCVGSRSAFLSALVDFKPDLVLSDYKLPDINGADALTLLKKSFSDVPFILVTGAVGEEAAVQVMKSGATDYILKDKLFRLVPAVNRALQETKEAARRKETEAL